MILQRSRFLHSLPVDNERYLLIHAVTHARLTIDRQLNTVVDFFATPRAWPDEYPSLATTVSYDRETLSNCIADLIERGFITDKSADEELAETTAKLGATYGRDPDELLDRYRRELKEGAHAYWSAGAARSIGDLGSTGKRVDLLLFGDCDVQMETDFLHQEAARRGIDLRIAATSPDDVRLASEHKHDAILIGALRARHHLTLDPAELQGPPHAAYILQARALLEELRRRSAAPILIDNLPEPTVQPLGLAERGLNGHRTRFRTTNVVLADLAAQLADVHVVDVSAAMGAIGSERMIDDGHFGFTHLGSPGWLLQRPESEKEAVHGLFPDIASLAELVGGDPYGREAAMARPYRCPRRHARH